MSDKRMKGIHLWLIIGLCASMAAGVGLTTNIAGLFLAPVSEELGLSRASMSATMSTCNIAFSLGGLFTAWMLRKCRFKTVVLLGATVTAAATLLLGNVTSLWQIFVLQGIRGLSTGLLGMVFATMVINQWFFENTALITSIVMSFSGLASALLSPVFNRIIETSGWKIGYYISAIAIALLYLLLIVPKVGLTPESVSAEAYGNRKETETSQPQQSDVSIIVTVLLLTFASLGGLTTSVVQHFPGVARSKGLTGDTGALMLSVAMLTNTAGKILLGAMIDRIGVRRSVLIMSVIIMAGTAGMLAATGSLLAVICAGIIGLGYSVATVGVSMLTREAAGVGGYNKVYPFVSMAITIAYAAGTTLSGAVYDKYSHYSYIFIAMLVYQTVIMLITLYLTGRKKQERR